MTLEHKKYAIIQEIISISREDIIDAIEEVVAKATQSKYSLDLSKHQSIKARVDIEQIKANKPLVDFDMKVFIEEANDLEWDKSTEELLAELK